MQRSSATFKVNGCVRRPYPSLLAITLKGTGGTGGRRDLRLFASSAGRGGFESRGEGRTRRSQQTEQGGGSGSGSGRDQMAARTPTGYMDHHLPRRYMREENMWHKPRNHESRWLHPVDPKRYKPNFKEVEPEQLRNQFMRSLDQRTREVANRDWQLAVEEAAAEVAAKAWREREEAEAAEAAKAEKLKRRTAAAVAHGKRRMDIAQRATQKAIEARRWRQMNTPVDNHEFED